MTETHEKSESTFKSLEQGIPNSLFIYFLNNENIKFPLSLNLVKRNCIDRRKAWILKLRIGKPVRKFMEVCSLHFAEGDYFYRSKDSKKRKILKKLHYLQINSFKS
ncbi:hypothetical protein NQ318_014430 [Aromia moschata]|uniref:THAP-type domain-containing protein n=1 Tax=Aromia moschata TaxID=1265417 RepID=A0AAV8Y6W7_9CUCU|nr:hypothetical protein NQ318_014430 [Aromia moschata]